MVRYFASTKMFLAGFAVIIFLSTLDVVDAMKYPCKGKYLPGKCINTWREPFGCLRKHQKHPFYQSYESCSSSTSLFSIDDIYYVLPYISCLHLKGSYFLDGMKINNIWYKIDGTVIDGLVKFPSFNWTLCPDESVLVWYPPESPNVTSSDVGQLACTSGTEKRKSFCLHYYWPVDGKWSDWSEGPCSATCGTGTKVRTRTCDNPPRSYGGHPCTGLSSETMPCLIKPCLITVGGTGGGPFDDLAFLSTLTGDKSITGIKGKGSSTGLFSQISLRYGDSWGPVHGPTTVYPDEFFCDTTGTKITGIEAYATSFIVGITFYLANGNVCGLYGNTAGTVGVKGTFDELKYISGRAGDGIDQIGFHF